MNLSKQNLYGILLVAVIALISFFLAQVPLFAEIGLSPFFLAIILGFCFGNTVQNRYPKEWTPGIQFCSSRVLPLAIALYGFRVSFQPIISAGVEGLLLAIFIVGSTLFLGMWLGKRVFNLDPDVSLLVSTGSAICGSTAILAVDGMNKRESYKPAIAIATVILFGTIAMFLYPVLQNNDMLGIDDEQYGLFAGATGHEMAQAAVAALRVSDTSAAIAVVVKMTRVLMLAPVLLALAIFMRKPGSSKNGMIIFPWFVLVFIGIIILNSFQILPHLFVNLMNLLDVILLSMVMVAIGMETSLKQIKQVGLKPFYLAGMLLVWLMVSSYLFVLISSI